MSHGAPGSQLASLKIRNQSMQTEERLKQERRRNILVLIRDQLVEFGYLESVEKLEGEAGANLSNLEVADNMSLWNVLVEYEEYHEFRFGRKPKIVRKIAVPEGGSKLPRSNSASRASLAANYAPPQGMVSVAKTSMSRGLARDPSPAASRSQGRVSSSKPPQPTGRKSVSREDPRANLPGTHKRTESAGTDGSARRAGPTDNNSSSDADANANGMDDLIVGKSTGTSDASARAASLKTSGNTRTATVKDSKQEEDGEEDPQEFFDRRMLKPLALFDKYCDSDMQELVRSIQRDIVVNNPNIRFDDIAELEEAKLLLKEAVIMPIKYPQLFTGIRSPWKGILFFGPPGTGKTMLAKAVATECQTTFFNISASTIVSKWRGDSEKLIRILFELARFHQPSTIFLDEIDAIMGQRSDSGNEHEGSRRMKTELLIQMDGLNRSDDLVFFMAASNLPWDLDQALLRRLEKRILVPLPQSTARKIMFENNLKLVECVPDMNYERYSSMTDGYSGADIKLVCKEAAMRPVRRLMKSMDKLAVGADAEIQADDCDPAVHVGVVTNDDIEKALECTKPSAYSKYLKRYEEWQGSYGSSLTFPSSP